MYSQRAEVLGNSSRLRRVGDQPDVSVRADEDQGVGAIHVRCVSVVVQKAIWPDKVGLEDVGFDFADHCEGAASAEAEKGEVRPTEEIEEANWRSGDGVAQRRVRCPVARSRSGGPACRVAGEPAPGVSEHELCEFGRGHGIHAAALTCIPAPRQASGLALIAGLVIGFRVRRSCLPAPDRRPGLCGRAAGSRGAQRSRGDAAGALEAAGWPRNDQAAGAARFRCRGIGLGVGRLLV